MGKNALQGLVLISLRGTRSRGGLHGADLKDGQDFALMVSHRNDPAKQHPAEQSSVSFL